MKKAGMQSAAWVLGGAVVGATLTAGIIWSVSTWAASVEIDPAAEYKTCLDLVRTRPKAALEKAGQWAGLGGGLAAEHCKAAAMDALGEHQTAAGMLEDLATGGRATAEIKAGLLRQAAESWVKADQIERAMGVLTAAIGVNPNDPGLYEDRALLKAGGNKVWDAVDDLNHALDLDPQRVSTLVLRAAAYRRLKSLDLAAADMDRAAKIDPKDPDLWLEAGNLALAQGRRDEARKDWMTVLQLAPDSGTADVARSNIEQMDVRK